MTQVFTRGQKSPVSALTTTADLYVGIDSGEGLALQFMGLQGHFVVVQPYEV